MIPTVLISRPKADAQAFCRLLKSLDQNIECILAPAISVESVEHFAPDMAFDALVLTSKHAAKAAADLLPAARCYCVGDATAAAAAQFGLQTISASGTSKDLLTLLSRSEDKKLLYVRGHEIHADIAAELSAAGFEMQSVIVYRQSPRAFSKDVMEGLAQCRVVIAPIFSARSAAIVAKNMASYQGDIIVVAISEQAASGWVGASPLKTVIAKQPNSKAIFDAIASQIACMP